MNANFQGRMRNTHDRSRSSPSRGDITSHRDTDSPSPKRRRTDNVIDTLLAKEVGLMRDGSGNGTTSFVGSASGIHFIRSVYGTVGPRAGDQTSPATDLVPGEDDRLAAAVAVGPNRVLWNDHEVEPNVQHSASTEVTFDDVLDLSGSFFDAWHPAFPFLHAPSVLTSFESLVNHGLSSLSPWEAVTVRAVLSISLADRRQTNKPFAKVLPKGWVFASFEEAHESILPALARSSTLVGIQACICVQLFLVSMLRLNTASRLTGLLVQMAYQLGLHRCPMRYHTFSLDERQLRKRIFWSIYCLERYICQAMGLPLTLRDEDIDVCHLHKELHRPSKQQTTVDKDLDQSFDTRLQLLVFLSEHAQRRGSIMELRNKRIRERDRDPEAAVFLSANLTEWWNEVGDFIDQTDPDLVIITPFHKVILETMRHESLIMLNRPLLASPKNTANYAKAIQSCISAAKSLLTLMYSLLHQSPSDDGPARLPMMWPSFTWSCWMSAFILLYAALEGKIRPEVTRRYIDKSLEILQRLTSRGSVWPEACAVAIQDLMSNLSDQNPELAPLSNKNGPKRNSRPVNEAVNGYQISTGATSFANQNPTSNNSQTLGNQILSAGQGTTFLTTGGNLASGSETRQQSNVGHNNNIIAGLGQPSYDFNKIWTDTNYLSISMPPIGFEQSDPFQGFDIPFWFGQDNYLSYINNNG